jgi:hypothetical protein
VPTSHTIQLLLEQGLYLSEGRAFGGLVAAAGVYKVADEGSPVPGYRQLPAFDAHLHHDESIEVLYVGGSGMASGIMKTESFSTQAKDTVVQSLSDAVSAHAAVCSLP